MEQNSPGGEQERSGRAGQGEPPDAEINDRLVELSAHLVDVLKRQPPGWRDDTHRLKEELARLKQAAKGSVRGWGHLPKDTVVGCRVDTVDLDAIDILVETGIRATRSDAASWFIHEGVKAQQGLLDEVRHTVDEIRRLRAQAQERARQQAGGEPPAAPEEASR